MSSSNPRKSKLHSDTTDVVSRETSAGQKRTAFNVIDITSLRQGAFEEAVTTASKGDRILYYVGEHCAGAHRTDARAAFECGSVLLTMRKRDRFVFEYIAIPVAAKSS